ncbi:hypothetical protein AVKW3434_05580 [Acidovorax sp. SUPP3434]|uniref:hypothetical protein n=1 Tax=Acidovorax sp. SUPP3434 TaxID=2920880 RepID=UPI0023DE53CF|nr:hypothetical protein [Acidovorax sp. SUPP3434]GKS98826.1 hypothetical protein AVKW3434_05580 [Acidovorax sp. SUPP3434]
MGWLRLFENRPLSTLDLAFVMFVVGIGWVTWDFIRTTWWLLADRIIPASEMLISWGEPPAQLESFKESGTRLIGLVRYSATCPECAAAIELRYGQAHQRRRLFGCCVEAPHEHVFTFDRVKRQGWRIH